MAWICLDQDVMTTSNVFSASFFSFKVLTTSEEAAVGGKKVGITFSKRLNQNVSSNWNETSLDSQLYYF